MTLNIKNICFVFGLAIFLSLLLGGFQITSANTEVESGQPTAPVESGQPTSKIESGHPTALKAYGIELFNPVGNKSIEDIFRAILDIIMVFAIPIILFFIVWAGFLYVTAGGNQSKIEQATKALTYAVIGGVLVLGANVLLAVITNTIQAFT